MIIINIRVPYFSAGTKYKWEGNPIGIGVPASQLRDKKEILQVNLKSDGNVYEIPVLKARELVLKYNSFFMAKETKLAIIPMQEFKITGECSKTSSSLDILQNEVLELIKFYTIFTPRGAKELFLMEYKSVFKKYNNERNRTKK